MNESLADICYRIIEEQINKIFIHYIDYLNVHFEEERFAVNFLTFKSLLSWIDDNLTENVGQWNTEWNRPFKKVPVKIF